ncbi:MAG: isoprenylcysteine carboxylmethyltransferase family protein [Balneolaceae bacterium]|nr:isoprenylcysteine carboxylmethyltransferase family protein [Balneolaceae bacterium]
MRPMDLLISAIITSLGFAGFAFLHTLLARRTVKEKLFGRWSALGRYYRLLYTLFALATFAAWYLLSPFPEGILYRIPFPYSIPFRIAQGFGLAGFLLSLRAVDLGEFIGTAQLTASPDELRPTGRQPAGELVTDGLYGWVRHPLYTTSVMVLLFNPVMSLKLGLITLLVAIYSWVGSLYEERNLVAQYGRAYEEYRQKVPRFIPKIPLF